MASENELLAVQLDEARRKEIDMLKTRMEAFHLCQMEITNELKLVLKGQDGLKERFEEGVSKRVASLDKKFDAFLIEWGKKIREDELRDERIKENKEAAIIAADKAEKKADTALNFFNKLALGFMGSIGTGLILALLIWAFKSIGHR